MFGFWPTKIMPSLQHSIVSMYCLITKYREYFILLHSVINPTDPHVVPNVYDCLLWNTKDISKMRFCPYSERQYGLICLEPSEFQNILCSAEESFPLIELTV